MVFCQNCGTQIPTAGARFCFKCGQPMPAEVTHTSPTASPAATPSPSSAAPSAASPTPQVEPGEVVVDAVETSPSSGFAGGSRVVRAESEDAFAAEYDVPEEAEDEVVAADVHEEVRGRVVEDEEEEEEEDDDPGAAQVQPRQPPPMRGGGPNPFASAGAAPQLPPRGAAPPLPPRGASQPVSFAQPSAGASAGASASAAAPSASSMHARLTEFYQRHNPRKLADPGFVERTLAAYAGREEALFADLRAKYGNSTAAPTGMPAPSSAESVNEAVDHIIEGLKVLYKRKIRPLEAKYKFNEFHSPLLNDTDIASKPMVLLLGQYSTGKTTFIKYLLEREFPGQHIGPEPTTDRFIAIMHGHDERQTPGNAVAVQKDKPFTALTKYGMAFLNRFECSQCPSPILEKLTFIDTPGVLSGEKQRIGRTYDFPAVIEWFAQRADRILLLFDAHKLDISDEFRTVIESVRGHDDKIRVILNKSDMVSGQALMRVYGALMWSLGKVIRTPEVLRVYIGSFWDKPYKNTENAALFDAESNDLLADLRSLPRNSAVRKVNELVKRARMAKVHAYIVTHLREQFGWFGKEKTQLKLLNQLAQEFRKVQRQYDLPKGDFPNLRRFRETLSRYEIHKFPKLDPALIRSMDEVLSRDLPKLMERLPGSTADDADHFTYGSVLNPFDDTNAALRDRAAEGWQIDAATKSKYDNIFHNLELSNGKASGKVAKVVFMQSGLPAEQLRKVWDLADIDKDGFLDAGEFAVAMYLMDSLTSQSIAALPKRLPRVLVPPEKRHLVSYQ